MSEQYDLQLPVMDIQRRHPLARPKSPQNSDSSGASASIQRQTSVMEGMMKFVEKKQPSEPNNTGGGFVDYYLQEVTHPQRGGTAYIAECDDIIRALELSFDEGEIFKEIWRTAKARKTGQGKPGNTLLRAREKIFHRATQLLNLARRSSG